jgi:hypothetical protein
MAALCFTKRHPVCAAMREASYLVILVGRSLMQSIWRKHLIICLFLGLLAIPIYFLDLAVTEEGGGNWITLDFRGLIFWTYITLLAIHVALSSIAVVSFPKSGALRIHFWSMVLSVILLVAGFVVYGKLLREGAISSQSANFDREVADL